MYLLIALGSMVIIEAVYIWLLQKRIDNMLLIIISRNAAQYVLNKVALKRGVVNQGQSDEELTRKDTLQGTDYLKAIQGMQGLED